jgi:hypothetical protein
LNVSVQNVHWKIRFFSSAILRNGAGAGLLRLRRSFFPARPELKDPNEPWECELCWEYLALVEADNDEDCLVSNEVVDAGRALEKPEPALERFFFLPRLEGEVEI